MKKKIVYLSMTLEHGYGGSVVSNTNLAAIKANTDIDVFEISIFRNVSGLFRYEFPGVSSKFKVAVNNLLGYAGRLNRDILKRIKCTIEEISPDYLYLDSSLLGGVASWCKREHPSIIVISFFHNVEFDFELSRLRFGKIHFIPSFFASYLAEKKSISYSDYIVALHRNDSCRLQSLYGRSANFIIPVCMRPCEISNDADIKNNILPDVKDRKFCIGFVGSAFYANVHAAKYIVDSLATLFSTDDSVRFLIAGKGFDSYSNSFCAKNIDVVGYVESLDDLYSSIDVVISPVFIGAGMKVKIAEAMKFNKKIIATPFSLIGYEQLGLNPDVKVCNDANEFKEAIVYFYKSQHIKPNTYSVFDKNFSFNALIEYFKPVFSGAHN